MTAVLPLNTGDDPDVLPEPQPVLNAVAATINPETINPKEMPSRWLGDEEAKRIKTSGWHSEGGAYILGAPAAWARLIAQHQRPAHSTEMMSEFIDF